MSTENNFARKLMLSEGIFIGASPIRIYPLRQSHLSAILPNLSSS
jgi:hypothetical protein